MPKVVLAATVAFLLDKSSPVNLNPTFNYKHGLLSLRWYLMNMNSTRSQMWKVLVGRCL